MPAPCLTPEQAQLVARGECGCGCGRLLPTVHRHGEWIVQPGRCWASHACQMRGCRQRKARPELRAQRLAGWRSEAAQAHRDAAQLRARGSRLLGRAERLRNRARRLDELVEGA